MFGLLIRSFGKKVKIPTGNAKSLMNLNIPAKEILPVNEFSRLSQEYLYKAKKALEEIKDSNENSKLEVQHSSLKFMYQDFSLTLERNFAEQSLQIFVGDGIVHNYFYDQETERWVCVTDGHLLEELLCREITRKCQGYFNI